MTLSVPVHCMVCNMLSVSALCSELHGHFLLFHFEPFIVMTITMFLLFPSSKSIFNLFQRLAHYKNAPQQQQKKMTAVSLL